MSNGFILKYCCTIRTTVRNIINNKYDSSYKQTYSTDVCYLNYLNSLDLMTPVSQDGQFCSYYELQLPKATTTLSTNDMLSHVPSRRITVPGRN